MRLALRAADETAMRAIGEALARALEAGTVVYLRGSLGAGKTTLARALIQALLPGVRVKSPTYALIESYPEAVPPIHHLDLYRIVAAEELELLGLRELADDGAAILVEWPERGAGQLPAADLELSIDAAEDARRIDCAALTGRGRRIAERLRASLPGSAR